MKHDVLRIWKEINSNHNENNNNNNMMLQELSNLLKWQQEPKR